MFRDFFCFKSLINDDKKCKGRNSIKSIENQKSSTAQFPEFLNFERLQETDENLDQTMANISAVEGL